MKKPKYVDARKRETFLGRDIGPRHWCEHCDGESSHMVRYDQLRGHICPVCDSALDEMFAEADDDEEARDGEVSL